MPSFDLLKESLECALNCARQIAEKSTETTNAKLGFSDELRRHRRDLPHFIEQALAKFQGDEFLTADLRHELNCVLEDALQVADWTKHTAEENDELRKGISIRADALQKWSDANQKAYFEGQEQKRILSTSCDRAYIAATRICEAADKSAEKPAAASSLASGETPIPKKESSSVEASIQEPVLSERQYEILEAMYNLKATDPARRKTTEEIAEAAEGPQANPEGFKRPIADLTRRGLIETKNGRGGGCWLTASGRDTAQQILKR